MKPNTYRPMKNFNSFEYFNTQKSILILKRPKVNLTANSIDMEVKNIKGIWSREPNNFFLTLKIIPLQQEDHMQEV